MTQQTGDPIKARLSRGYSHTLGRFAWFLSADVPGVQALFMGDTQEKALAALADWNAARSAGGLAPW